MSSTDEARRSLVVTRCHEESMIGPSDCGYQYFWVVGGCLSAFDLRCIADELDRINEDWDRQLQAELSKGR